MTQIIFQVAKALKHKVQGFGFILLGFSTVSLVAAAPIDKKISYDSPACQISNAWCVGNLPDNSRDYRQNELLLLYDARQSARFAEDILQRYRLTQKRSDELGAIRDGGDEWAGS